MKLWLPWVPLWVFGLCCYSRCGGILKLNKAVKLLKWFSVIFNTIKIASLINSNTNYVFGKVSQSLKEWWSSCCHDEKLRKDYQKKLYDRKMPRNLFSLQVNNHRLKYFSIFDDQFSFKQKCIQCYHFRHIVGFQASWTLDTVVIIIQTGFFFFDLIQIWGSNISKYSKKCFWK